MRKKGKSMSAGRIRHGGRAALLRLSGELAAAPNEDEVCHRVVSGLHDTLGYDHVALYFVDEPSGRRVVAAAVGFAEPPLQLLPGQGLSERPLLDGQIHYTPDVTQEPRYLEGMGGSEVDVPVRIGGEVLAVLIAESKERNAFHRDDFEVLTAVAQQAGLAIEKARLLATERQRADELDALRTTMAEVTAELELSALLQAIVERAAGLLGASGGELALYDELNQEIRVVVSYNLGEDYVGVRHKLGEGAMGRVVETGEPLIIDDYRTWEGGLPEYSQIRATLAVPLQVGGRLVGVFTTVTVDPERQFGSDDLRLLNLFAQQAAIAVQNAWLFEDAKRRVAQLSALQRASSAVASILDVDMLLDLILQQATRLVQADGGVINLVDWRTREDEVAAATGVAEALLGGFSPLEGSLSGWAALHNEAVLSGQVSADSRVDRAALAVLEETTEGGLESVAVAPMATKDQVMGTLVVMGKRGGRGKFDRADLDLLVAFANQAATAIENARLFQSQQRQAEQFRLISEVGRHMVTILDVDQLLAEIVRLVSEILGYYLVGIGLVEGDEVVIKTGVGPYFEREEREALRLALGREGMVGWVASTGEPLVAPDVTLEPHYYHVPEIPETRSELTVPLRTKDKVIGVLDIQSRHLDAFDQSDLIVLQSLADQAAIAIENSRLHEQSRQLAVLEERQRLARDLHDSVTQALYGMTLYAQAASGQLSLGHQDRVAEHLRSLQETSQEALAEMRMLIYELHPPVLEDGLAAALQARLLAVEERAGLTASFEVDGVVVLPAAVEEELYRIAQEALNNSLKHSRAQTVVVRVRSGAGMVAMEIVDDGMGFDPLTARQKGGLGLLAMEERAKGLGARLEVLSSPGEGTRVVVEVEA